MIKLFISSLMDMRQFHGKVSHVLSMVDPDDGSTIPSLGVPEERRLVLLCDDVDSSVEALTRERTMPGSRCIAPTRAMVKKALAFAKALPDDARLLVHCGHGISRSTALGFAILCQAQPDLTEEKVYRQILRLRPQAFPNALIVTYADALLSRNGKMSRAIPSGKAKSRGRSQK